MQIPDFQKNGTFDPEVYKQLLAANHLTPATFEAMEAKEVLSNKARMVIRDAVALTPAELAEAQALTLRQTESDPAKASRSERPRHTGRPLSKATTCADGLHAIPQNDHSHQDQPRVALAPFAKSHQIIKPYSLRRSSVRAFGLEGQMTFRLCQQAAKTSVYAQSSLGSDRISRRQNSYRMLKKAVQQGRSE